MMNYNAIRVLTLHDVLHFGVKGMKWGIIKGSGTSTAAIKKKISSMSDADLKKAVNRAELEKKMVTIETERAAKNKTRAQKGQEFVTKIVAKQLEATATAVVTHASKSLITYGTKAIDAEIQRSYGIRLFTP